MSEDREWASARFPMVHKSSANYKFPEYNLPLPNIIFLLAESFNAFPLLLNESFFRNNDGRQIFSSVETPNFY